MRIAILSRKASLYSTSRLVEACRQRGAEVSVLDPLSCLVKVSKRRPEVFHQGERITGLDGVVPRIGASITFYGLAVLRQFEMMGVFPANESQAIARSRDKLRSLQLLSRHDIGIPPTAFVRQKEDVRSAIRKVGGAPVILKLLEGTQGVGVILAESAKSAESVLDAMHSLKQNILIQAYIKEAAGTDYRAIVVGQRVVAAMMRQAGQGEFRSNLHRGGTAQGVSLDPAFERTAVHAAEVLGVEHRRRRHAPLPRGTDGARGQQLSGPGGDRKGDWGRCRRHDDRLRGRKRSRRRPPGPRARLSGLIG